MFKRFYVPDEDNQYAGQGPAIDYERIGRILLWYKAGLKPTEIARHLQVSRQYVSEVVKRELGQKR